MTLVAFFVVVFSCFAEAQSIKRPNIILVTIDTLRADHLGCYGYGHKTSPNIDRLASRGLLFRHAFAPTPLTLPSHASIFTGLYPANHGYFDNAFFQTANNWYLAQNLKEAGYTTAAFVSAAPLLSRFGLSRGFDFYEDQFEGSERSAAHTAELALRWLAKTGSPYFLWVHFFDPHAEYDPPAEFLSRHSGKPYDGEIAFVDHYVGKLIDAAGSHVNWIITSDHGESLGEHGESTHGVFLYNSTLHVPLILAGPNIVKGDSSREVSLCDIAPTIMKLAGLEITTEFDGASLFELPTERILFAESQYAARNFGLAGLYAAIKNREKYISAPEPEFYNLDKDPQEKHNSLQQGGNVALKASIEAYRIKRFASKEPALSDEDREKLRSLGYVSGQTAKTDQTIDPKNRIRWIEEFNSAMALLKMEKFDSAEASFRKLLQQQPDSPMAARFLANVFAAKKQYVEAAGYYSASLKIHQDPEVAIQLAKTLSRLNRMEEAELQLKDNVRDFPEFSEARFELASLYTAKRQFEDALSLLDPGLNSINVAEVQNQRGIVFLAKGDFQNAVVEFERASKSQEKPQYSNNLGIALRQQQRLEEAEAAFLRALELKSAYEEAEMNLCFTLIMNSKEEARSRLEKITTRNPQLLLARLALGSVYENLGEQELALKQYKKLFADVPSNWKHRAELETKITQLERE